MTKRTKLIDYIRAVIIILMLFIVGDSFFFPAGDTPEPSDVIIVLNGNTGRLEEAAGLYRRGYAEKVLLTPVSDEKFNNFLSVKKAVELGITESALIIDHAATSTYENATISRDVMIDHHFSSAVIVTSDYHVKRARLIFDRVMPEHFRLHYVGALSDKGQRWYEREGRQYIWQQEFLNNWGYRLGLYRWFNL